MRPVSLSIVVGAVVVGAAAFTPAVAAEARGDKGAYEAAKAIAKSAYEVARKKCDAMAGVAKDVCVAEAKATRTKAEARAEATYKGTPEARESAAEEIAEAEYKVDRERCNERSGNDKDVCVKVAKAELTRAKANAKARLKTIEARNDAAGAKRDADYDVAVQRCAGLAAGEKRACVDAAKTRYGK